jgi:hypothetical protein
MDGDLSDAAEHFQRCRRPIRSYRFAIFFSLYGHPFGATDPVSFLLPEWVGRLESVGKRCRYQSSNLSLTNPTALYPSSLGPE